jgi:Tol biopolymer transport system component
MIPDYLISYSPDGSRLAAIGDWYAAVIVNLDEVTVTPFSVAAYERFLNWYADSRKVLIMANMGQLWLADPFTGEHVTLSATGYGMADVAAAAPDGKMVIFAVRGSLDMYDGIWISGADGRDSRRLIETPWSALDFTWSPDSQLIAYYSDGFTIIDQNGHVLIKLDGIYPPPCYPASPAWSPDSRYLAVVVADAQADFCGGLYKSTFNDANIIVIEVDTGNNWPLLPDGSLGNIDPAWSPDGKQIAFVSNRDGSQALWVVNVDGTNLRQITENGLTVFLPKWITEQTGDE